MDSGTETREALRLLAGLENGGMTAFDAMLIAEAIDPVHVYMIIRFLRECYPASDPAASPVLERVVELTASYAGLVPKCREGEQDSVSAWFEDEYSFRDFRGRGEELVAIIADKLDSVAVVLQALRAAAKAGKSTLLSECHHRFDPWKYTIEKRLTGTA